MSAPASSGDIGRRKFLTGVIAIVAGAVSFVLSVPAVSYLLSPGLKKHADGEWFPLGPIAEVVPGTPRGYRYSRTVKDGWNETTQSGVAYAVTHDGITFKVYSNICTHLQCRVKWIEDRQIFLSPCHDGVFSIDGDVISGPPPRPLDQFEVKIENGQMWRSQSGAQQVHRAGSSWLPALFQRCRWVQGPPQVTSYFEGWRRPLPGCSRFLNPGSPTSPARRVSCSCQVDCQSNKLRSIRVTSSSRLRR